MQLPLMVSGKRLQPLKYEHSRGQTFAPRLFGLDSESPRPNRFGGRLARYLALAAIQGKVGRDRRGKLHAIKPLSATEFKAWMEKGVGKPTKGLGNMPLS